MLQQTQTHHQTLLNNGRRSNSIEAVREALQHRETLPAGQVPLLFVPATAEKQVNDATKEAAEAAEVAEAAKAKTKALKEKLAALRAKQAATNNNANTRAAENAQRAAAAVKAAEKAVKAAGETEARTVKVACGELSDAAVDLQQLFVSAVASKSGVHQPTNSVSLDLNGTLRLAKSLARSAATLEELDVRCPDPKFPTLPKLSLTLPNPFGSRTATAAPPPPPPGGPGYTLADWLPSWPGRGGPPPVPPAAEPAAAAMLVAAAAPPRPPNNGTHATLRLRLRTAHGFHSGDLNSVAAAAGNKRGHIFKPANNSLRGVKGTTNVGGVANRVKHRAAGEGGGTRRRRTRHRGTRRH